VLGVRIRVRLGLDPATADVRDGSFLGEEIGRRGQVSGGGGWHLSFISRHQLLLRYLHDNVDG